VRGGAAADDDRVPGGPGDPPQAELSSSTERTPVMFDKPVYDRGPMTLHALRGAIGDEAFFRLLTEWPTRQAGENVTTEEFVVLAEEVSGQRLDGLFTPGSRCPRSPPGCRGPERAHPPRLPPRCRLGPPVASGNGPTRAGTTTVDGCVG
jgi:hypothetical protein